jgi:hypothetical protein
MSRVVDGRLPSLPVPLTPRRRRLAGHRRSPARERLDAGDDLANTLSPDSMTWFLLLAILGIGEVALTGEARQTASPRAAEPAVLATLTYSDSGFDCGTNDSLTILADGTIRSSVTVGGRCPRASPPKAPAKRKLTSRELAQLIAAFEDKAYLFAQPVRERRSWAGDVGYLVSIFYARAPGTRTLRYEPGVLDPRVRAIRELESRMHEILGTRDWMRDWRR